MVLTWSPLERSRRELGPEGRSRACVEREMYGRCRGIEMRVAVHARKVPRPILCNKAASISSMPSDPVVLPSEPMRVRVRSTSPESCRNHAFSHHKDNRRPARNAVPNMRKRMFASPPSTIKSMSLASM